MNEHEKKVAGLLGNAMGATGAEDAVTRIAGAISPQMLADHEARLQAEKMHRMAWDDLTDTQKIDRLREVIKQLQQTVGYLSREVRGDLSKLKEHGHDALGQIVVPLNGRHGYGAELAGEARTDSGKPWF